MHTLLIGLGIISASYFLGHLIAKAWASFIDFGQRRFDEVYGRYPSGPGHSRAEPVPRLRPSGECPYRYEFGDWPSIPTVQPRGD